MRFPVCPNHGLPMLLKNMSRGTYWYCPDNCAHTENFFGRSKQRVVAVNGRPSRSGAFGPHGAQSECDTGGSKVEAKAIRDVDAGEER